MKANTGGGISSSLFLLPSSLLQSLLTEQLQARQGAGHWEHTVRETGLLSWSLHVPGAATLTE